MHLIFLNAPNVLPGRLSHCCSAFLQLQDAADYKDSHAAHVAHDAMVEDRLHRDRRIEL
jgi:hypothetical protein